MKSSGSEPYLRSPYRDYSYHFHGTEDFPTAGFIVWNSLKLLHGFMRLYVNCAIGSFKY